jgi:hypothetical protein
MRKVFEIGGLVAGLVLIVMGTNGQSTVSSALKQQQIAGTPDMSPSAFRAEAAKAA